MDAISVIRERLEDFQCSPAGFARSLGVSHAAVHHVLSGKERLSLPRFIRWCDALALRVVLVDGVSLKTATVKGLYEASPALQSRRVLVQPTLDRLEADGWTLTLEGIPASPDGVPAWLPGLRR